MKKDLILVVLTLLLGGVFASAQMGSPAAPSPPPAPSQAAPAFDINAAVEAYLAKMPPERRAQSNAYFEGGYWLLFWDFLYSAIVMLLLLRMRWSEKMRDFAERLTQINILAAGLRQRRTELGIQQGPRQ